jgi:hypothetical protein
LSRFEGYRIDRGQGGIPDTVDDERRAMRNKMIQRYMQMVLIVLAMILGSILLWSVLGPAHWVMPQ